MTTVALTHPPTEKLIFDGKEICTLPTLVFPLTGKIEQVDVLLLNTSDELEMMEMSVEFSLFKKVILLPSDPIFELKKKAGQKTVHVHCDTAHAMKHGVRKVSIKVHVLDKNVTQFIKVTLIEPPVPTTSNSPQEGSPQAKKGGASGKSHKRKGDTKNKNKK
ncbi:hypothetical protein PRIPAC_74017 [Pristionchus pacificus]|uniref:Uncharacterized protein n=1 Tax=Pristionchus pacificus TaxID=54126 RepID=A0A454XJ37_PRIPA|nr:hypothetical protein PRIPAC_74017 [Pristionchus pacificus]|eukprot:PDM64405.1 hypothetical protein PRIPAC_52661 [Pristionchus pacificus]